MTLEDDYPDVTLPETRTRLHRQSAKIVHELLPSASRHVAMALVHVPGPEHTIEPQPYYRLSFNIGPSYSFKTGGAHGVQAVNFKRHCLLVIPPGAEFTHCASSPPPAGSRSRPGRLATFRISCELFAQGAMSLGLPHRQAQIAHKVVVLDEILRLLAQTLFADLSAGSPDGPAATERSATALVCRLLTREYGSPCLEVPSAVGRVKSHIEANLSQELSLDQLAALADMSVFHFCRVFRDSFGLTPHQYILAQRLEQAQRLLWAHGNVSMLEIALSCGFGSSSHFAAQFKKHTGQAPLSWQRSH